MAHHRTYIPPRIETYGVSTFASWFSVHLTRQLGQCQERAQPEVVNW